MKNSALLVLSFYLSKFGSKTEPKAYQYLNFKNASEAFMGIAEKLSIRKNTVKNYCDTFDPLHGHRQGWHQKPLQPRFKNIADALKDVAEGDLGNVCKKILANETYRESESYLTDLNIQNSDDFEDLSELFKDLQSKAIQLEQRGIDQESPFDLQQIVKEAAKNSHEITFDKHCSKLVIKSSKNKLIVPNLAFFMALESLGIFKAVNEYNEAFSGIYERLKAQGTISSADTETFYQDLMKAENQATVKKIFDEFVPNYLKEIGRDSQVNLERFTKFINDKKWKSAGKAKGKNPGRGDTWQSPVLTAFATSHSNQGFICELVDILSKSPEDLSLYSLLNGSADRPSVSSPRNLIVYGAPGTGKSHYISNLLQNANSLRTVFHSETQNSDFVGSLKPVTKKDPNSNLDKVTYEFIAGPFIQAFVTAIEKPEEQIHLIIEEINRANAAAVFGEIFQLLDRDFSGRSQYVIHPDETLSRYLSNRLGSNFKGVIFLPENLYLNATMNSSDQGVYPLDSAFKRRWSFKYMPIDFEACPVGEITVDERTISWRIFATSINEVLSAEFPSLEEDRLIGPWFLSQEEVASNLHSAIQSKIFTYLWNDVLRHHQKDKIFNKENIKTFADLVKTFNQKTEEQKLPIFSEKVQEEFDRQIRHAALRFQDAEITADDLSDEGDLENDS